MGIYDFKYFVDCGSPSLYNRLSRKYDLASTGTMGSSFAERKYDDYSYTELSEYKDYRDRFIAYMFEHKDDVTHYSNLDVINNPEKTYENQCILEEAGLEPIPVFHLGNDTKWLEFYIKNYDYIAIGGLVPNPTRVLLPMLDRLFKECIVDDRGFPKVKLHGFACTSIPLMIRYPWYSVDSATCKKLGIYGSILMQEYSTGKLKPISVSTRDTPKHWKQSPGLWREIERRAKDLGIETDAETLGKESTERYIWNYLTYMKRIMEGVPNWPWSISTGKPAPEAQDFLNFYYSGSVDSKKEALFWQRVNDSTTLDLDGKKNRLASFFYPKEVEFIRKLRKQSEE